MQSYWHKTCVYLEWILRGIKIIPIIATRGKEDISLSKLNSERLELKAEECELCFASKSSILLGKLCVVFNENTYCAGTIKTFSVKIWKVQMQTNHFPLPESWDMKYRVINILLYILWCMSILQWFSSWWGSKVYATIHMRNITPALTVIVILNVELICVNHNSKCRYKLITHKYIYLY